MAKRMRVVTGTERPTPVSKTPRAVVATDVNPKPTQLTKNEVRARVNRRYATATSMGGMGRTADTINSAT